MSASISIYVCLIIANIWLASAHPERKWHYKFWFAVGCFISIYSIIGG